MALSYFKKRPIRKALPQRPLAPWILGIAGALSAVLLYGLVLLGFGIDPGFPPLLAIGSGLLLVCAALYFIPKWTADPRWRRSHLFALIFGTLLGSMLISFVGFTGTAGPDLYFKVITNVLAVALLVALGSKISKATVATI
jgi:hypothetical protein